MPRALRVHVMEDALPQDFGRINLLQWSVSVIKKKGPDAGHSIRPKSVHSCPTHEVDRVRT
jgi:hypothetical protein